MLANTVIHCLDHSIKIIHIYKMDTYGYLESVINGLIYYTPPENGPYSKGKF